MNKNRSTKNPLIWTIIILVFNLIAMLAGAIVLMLHPEHITLTRWERAFWIFMIVADAFNFGGEIGTISTLYSLMKLNKLMPPLEQEQDNINVYEEEE